MSPIQQAISYIAELLTPFTSPSQSPGSETRGGKQPKQPTEFGESYFPQIATPRSRGSSISSTSTEEPFSAKLPRSQIGDYAPEPLAREYPKPSEEIDVAKQLALEPKHRSLHDSLRRAATRERPMISDDAETKAKKLAAAKANLLALAKTI